MSKDAQPAPRRRRRSCLRRFLWLVGIVFGLLAVVVLGIYLYLRQSLPQIEGTAQVSGLVAPVEIVRDQAGVPHIFAQNELDALFGLGYVHAQDRLWQMQFQRRIAQGTLSEVLGETTVSTDRFLRTLGVYRAAESAYTALDSDTRRWLDAYVAGINAFLASHSGSDLPPEFTLVGDTPKPWTGADVLAWSKMMSWDLSGNYQDELLRQALLEKLGLAQTNQLMPDYPSQGVRITNAGAGGAPIMPLLALSLDVQSTLNMGAGIVGGTGSNNWVIAGSKSATGAPLLANDPHLGLRTPSIWYLAGIHGGRLDMVGGTIPGLPGVLSGHNQSIAWGVTNLGPDVQDLYQERLDPSGTHVEYNGTFEPLKVISDTIIVKDKGALPLTIRISRHGPLISDALDANDPEHPQPMALAFRWTSLDATDTTMKAFFGIATASSWEEFTGALRDYVAPAQNFVYADVQGNIGYYAPGNIPIRAQGDGSVPAEGWTGAMEWSGFIPFEELPHVYNPPSAMIVTANNKAVPDSYPYFLSYSWAAPFRAERITSLLKQQQTLAQSDIERIQSDQYSLYAAQALPQLLAQTTPSNDQQRKAFDLLSTWDYVTSKDSAAAAIFEAWNYYLQPPVIGDELGAELLGDYGTKRSFVDLFMLTVLNDPASPWCDDISTPSVEDCASRYQIALNTALEDLAFRTRSQDPATWRWGDVHLAFFPHQPLDNIRLLRSLFSRTIGNGGDGSTVDVAPVAADAPFDQVHGPALRSVINVSSWEDSKFITTPGQSGHFMSDYYDNMLQAWQQVDYVPMRFTRASVDAAAVGTLRLEPGGSTP